MAHESRIDPTTGRDQHIGRVHATGAHSRAQLDEYAMIKPPSVLNRCDSGAHEPRRDLHMTRREHRPPTATSSGKSRSVASHATERRSLEHDSDQTTHCHHANKLAMLLATIYEISATICTICSHRSQSLRAHAERQMSASAAVARRAWDQRKGGLACAWRLSELGAVCRVRNHEAYRLSVSPSADLLARLYLCTCHAPTRYAFRMPFGLRHAHDARPCLSPNGTVVRSRSRPWEVHAHNRPDGIATRKKYDLQDPPTAGSTFGAIVRECGR